MHNVLAASNHVEPEEVGRRNKTKQICCSRLHARFQHVHRQQAVGAKPFFCFEHPASAHSWKRAAVQEIMNHPDVTCTSFDQCRTGLTCPETGRPIKKRTTLMSNAPGVPLQFRPLQCHCSVPHVRIQGSSCGVRLSTYCQIYTPELCDHLAAACERTLHS